MPTALGGNAPEVVRMGAARSEPAALADDAAHLLVVDDDNRIRDLLSRFLLSRGIYREVTTAGIGCGGAAPSLDRLLRL